MSAAARSLLLAQVSFFLALAVCVLIDSTGVTDNHGWSYYESRTRTVAPYVLGFLALMLLITHSAALLAQSAVSPSLARGLRLLSVFLLLDVATPDRVDVLFYWAHELTSALLFLFELGFALWLVRTISATPLSLGLLVAQFLGGLVAMFSQLQLISRLGVGILVFQVSFGVMLVAATARFHTVVPDEAHTRTDLLDQRGNL